MLGGNKKPKEQKSVVIYEKGMKTMTGEISGPGTGLDCLGGRELDRREHPRDHCNVQGLAG